MSLLSPRIRRLTCVLALTLTTWAATTAAAVAARPAAGEWLGTNDTVFEVRGGRIQVFQNRCAPRIDPISVIRVRPDGRFAFDKRVSQADGSKRRYRVTGRFTSAFDVTGTVRSPGCTAKFTARSRTAPEPEPAPDPVAPE